MIKIVINSLLKAIGSEARKICIMISQRYDKLMTNGRSFRFNKEEVNYWKNKTFYITLTVLLIIGAVLMLYGGYFFCSTGKVGPAVTEILIYFVSAVIVLNKAFSVNLKKQFIILVLYGISICLLLGSGVLGGGFVCMVFTLVLAGCILDKKQIVSFVVENFLVFTLLTVLLFTGGLKGTAMDTYKELWIINAITTQSFGMIPIWLFITSGFEHSVANMCYIPAGIMAKGNNDLVDAAMALGVTPERLDHLNWLNFLTKNLIPVTLGNIIGGGIFVAAIYWFVYIRNGKNVTTQLEIENFAGSNVEPEAAVSLRRSTNV